MRLRYAFVALALVVLAASAASANIAPPNMPRKPDSVRTDLPASRMSIESQAGLREARLQVPRRLLDQFAAGNGQMAGASSVSVGTLAPLRTVMAGVFLSLAVALAGVLLGRSRRQLIGRVAVFVLVCLIPTAVAMVGAFANAAPPTHLRAQDPGTLLKAIAPGGGVISGSVRVEVVEDGNEIKLIVPSGRR